MSDADCVEPSAFAHNIVSASMPDLSNSTVMIYNDEGFPIHQSTRAYQLGLDYMKMHANGTVDISNIDMLEFINASVDIAHKEARVLVGHGF